MLTQTHNIHNNTRSFDDIGIDVDNENLTEIVKVKRTKILINNADILQPNSPQLPVCNLVKHVIRIFDDPHPNANVVTSTYPLYVKN